MLPLKADLHFHDAEYSWEAADKAKDTAQLPLLHPANALGEAAGMVQVPGHLPPTLESHMEFWILGFSPEPAST